MDLGRRERDSDHRVEGTALSGLPPAAVLRRTAMNTPVVTLVASRHRTCSTLGSAARIVILLAVLGLAQASPASAQTLGTFRWQLQPYCNVVSLTITQQGGQYTADGTDDQCGAPQKASVRGMAFQNPDGTIGFGLGIVTARGGAPVHVDAAILMATLNGSWSDSAGNNGTFIFTPGAGAGGDRRPVPSGGLAPASVTMIQMAPNSVGTSQVLDGSLRAADFSDRPLADYSGGNQTVPLTFTIWEIRSVTLSLPAAGMVIVNASGYFSLESIDFDSVKCSITTGSVIEDAYAIRADDAGHNDGRPYLPFGATRGYLLGAAGTFTVRLLCTKNAGTVSVRDTNLTALFVAR
jgi:hypothetical protein